MIDGWRKAGLDITRPKAGHDGASGGVPSRRDRGAWPRRSPRTSCRGSSFAKRRVELRAITLRQEKRDRPVTMSAKSPSARAVRSALLPVYLNGSIATQKPSSARATPESAAEDRARSAATAAVRFSVAVSSPALRSPSSQRLHEAAREMPTSGSTSTLLRPIRHRPRRSCSVLNHQPNLVECSGATVNHLGSAGAGPSPWPSPCRSTSPMQRTGGARSCCCEEGTGAARGHRRGQSRGTRGIQCDRSRGAPGDVAEGDRDARAICP